MIKFEHTVTPSSEQWKAVIIGARNPLNSWDKSDSGYCSDFHCGLGTCEKNLEPICPVWNKETEKCDAVNMIDGDYIIGPNDYDLMKRLRNAGTDHRKFMRMLPVMVTITAPLYWWKEMDQYRVGQTTNSCSTMHKIAAKEFTLEDFSHEHLCLDITLNSLMDKIAILNRLRDVYLNGGILHHANGNVRAYGKKEKDIWWQMIQLLPSSYNQKRTVMMNYEVLANIYKSRRNHKLDEWSIGFMDWIKTLPYSEFITGKFKEEQ